MRTHVRANRTLFPVRQLLFMGSGIEYPDSVDLVTINDAERYVKLIVVGPVAWAGSAHEQGLLARKLASYLRFVESGQVFRSYPGAAGHRVVFQIDTSAPLPSSLHESIQRIAKTLTDGHDIELIVEET